MITLPEFMLLPHAKLLLDDDDDAVETAAAAAGGAAAAAVAAGTAAAAAAAAAGGAAAGERNGTVATTAGVAATAGATLPPKMLKVDAPPGGRTTRVEGRPVIEFPAFCREPSANALEETLATGSAVSPPKRKPSCEGRGPSGERGK